MPNKKYAKEWLEFAYKNLDTANFLYKSNYYEDIVGVEIQQSVEKSLKAIFAYFGILIPKEHDLVKLSLLCNDFFEFNDDDLEILQKITTYYKDQRYPNPSYFLPSKGEIKYSLDYANNLFENICLNLGINL